MAYGGKEDDQIHRDLDQDIVLNLPQACYWIGRDVCRGNFFTSYYIAKVLLE